MSVDAAMIGKQYYGLVTGGAYAEYAAASVDMLRPIPPGVDPVTAYAVLAEADVAALAFKVAGRLQAGESVFVPLAVAGRGGAGAGLVGWGRPRATAPRGACAGPHPLFFPL